MLAYFTSLAHVVSLFLLIFLSVVPPSHPGDQAFPSVPQAPVRRAGGCSDLNQLGAISSNEVASLKPGTARVFAHTQVCMIRCGNSIQIALANAAFSVLALGRTENAAFEQDACQDQGRPSFRRTFVAICQHGGVLALRYHVYRWRRDVVARLAVQPQPDQVGANLVHLRFALDSPAADNGRCTSIGKLLLRPADMIPLRRRAS